MKIAVISTVFGNPWAGSEELWYQTSLQCLSLGHQVMASVFEVSGPCSQLDNFRLKGGELEFRKRFKNGRFHVLKHKYFSAFTNVFAWKPDTIILSLGCMTDLALYPDLERHLRARGRAKVIMITLFNADNIILDEGTRNILSSFCRMTDHFVFVSRHNHQLAERQLAMKLNNVSVFSSPVSYLDGYKALPWPEGKGKIKMACVARLDIAHKGHDVLLESLSSQKWKNRDWELSIYGNGPDEEYIRKLVSYYGLEKNVRFAGFVSDTREIWKEHHWLVMASRSEGLSLAVLEAMICGRICVVSDVGGHGEVIEDSISGFLAEAALPKYFEAALERAWNMSDKYLEIGAAAKRSAEIVFQDKPVDKMVKMVVNE